MTCSFGSECCRLRNSATALAGNSVSQTYPKSLARCTASPAKGEAGGDGEGNTQLISTHSTEERYIRKKNQQKKARLSTWAFLLKDGPVLFLSLQKGTVRNANPILSCRSCLLLQSRAMQMCIFMTIFTSEISHSIFFFSSFH